MTTTKINVLAEENIIVGTVTQFTNDDGSIKGRLLQIPAFGLKAQVFKKDDGDFRISIPENYTTSEGEEKTYWHDIGTVTDNHVQLPAFNRVFAANIA